MIYYDDLDEESAQKEVENTLREPDAEPLNRVLMRLHVLIPLLLPEDIPYTYDVTTIVFDCGSLSLSASVAELDELDENELGQWITDVLGVLTSRPARVSRLFAADLSDD